MSKQINELKAHKIIMLGAMAESGQLAEVQEIQRHIQAVLDAASSKELAMISLTLAYFDGMIANPEMIED